MRVVFSQRPDVLSWKVKLLKIGDCRAISSGYLINRKMRGQVIEF